ncbi:MAG: leucine-rich repeat domain-containing protein [Clostridia bacterium]|nr:leucine-rich repeat domain-containing protein [Clostridia bacterium]
MKTTKKGLSILLCALLLTLSLSVCFVSLAADASGGCGSGLTWTYREGTKTLTISGTGEIDDYSIGVEHGAYVTRAPWFPYHYEVTKIVFENGVKRIGKNAFRYFKNVTKLEFPRSLESIGPYAFLECTNLVTVNFGSGVKSIGANAFNECTALSRFSIPDQVLSIGEYAFYKVPVENLVLGKNLESIGSYAFSECKLIAVTMHNNVAVIGKGAFFKQNGNKTSTISHVYYDGSEYEWNSIVIGQDNEPLTGAAIHYNSTGPATPTQPTQPDTQPTQPTTSPSQDESPVKLSFFERIIQMILDFFARLFGR